MKIVKKTCASCGQTFSFVVEDGKYRMASRRYCDSCRRLRDLVVTHGVGARTTDVSKEKPKKRKKPVSFADMDRFAKSIGKTYGQTVALIEAGMLEYKHVPKPKKEKTVIDIGMAAVAPSNACLDDSVFDSAYDVVNTENIGALAG